MFVSICPTVFEIQGFEISRKHLPPTPNFAETLPRLCCPEETRFPAKKEKKNEKKKNNVI